MGGSVVDVAVQDAGTARRDEARDGGDSHGYLSSIILYLCRMPRSRNIYTMAARRLDPIYSPVLSVSSRTLWLVVDGDIDA